LKKVVEKSTKGRTTFLQYQQPILSKYFYI